MSFEKSSQRWRELPKESNDPKVSGIDTMSIDSRKVGQMVRKSPFNSNTLNTYWSGIAEFDITGGVLDGVSYSVYHLTIRIHHKFSKKFPSLTPLYFFWSLKSINPSSERTIILNGFPEITDQISMGGSASDGVWTHKSYFKDNSPSDNDEYIEFFYSVSVISGTLTILPQTRAIIPAIVYFGEPLQTYSATSQGGGGGILAEIINIYIE